MRIENIDGIIVLYADGSNKITDIERTFFSDKVYLGIKEDINNYLEVTIDVWWDNEDEDKNIDIINRLDKTVFKLEQSLENTNIEVVQVNDKIKEATDSVYVLEDIVIDTDYRLMVVEMQLEYGGDITPLSLFSLNQRKEAMDVYSLLRKKIERKNYDSKEEMQTMLDLYFFNTRITADQYDELTQLLSEQ